MTKNHEEQKKIQISWTSGLVKLLASLEKINYEGKKIKELQQIMGTSLLVLPTTTTSLEPPIPSGVDDVMALSMIFAGIFPSEILQQFTYDQLYYYTPFLLKSRRMKKE